jgi:proliferating cell nuclear antigen
MEIILKNNAKAETFVAIFQHMRIFSDHVNIIFDENRMYLQSMDTSRVSIFEVELQKDWFDNYENSTAVCLGISASLLYKILSAREKTQELNIVYNEEESDKLSLHFTSDNKSIFDKHFEMPLIDIEEQLMEIPETDSHAELTINSTNFANIINQLKMFGDTLDIDCSEEKICLHSSGQETGKMSVEIGIDDLNEFSINEGANLKLSFSLTCLHNICLYNKICKEVDIKWITDFPMQVTYKIDEKAKMKFYLAPKISDD